jgi:hypothetical protein
VNQVHVVEQARSRERTLARARDGEVVRLALGDVGGGSAGHAEAAI